MSDKLRLRINKTFGGFSVGDVKTVDATNGVPHEQYWRDRIKDSAIDECVTILPEEEPKPAKRSSNRSNSK